MENCVYLYLSSPLSLSLSVISMYLLITVYCYYNMRSSGINDLVIKKKI